MPSNQWNGDDPDKEAEALRERAAMLAEAMVDESDVELGDDDWDIENEHDDNGDVEP